MHTLTKSKCEKKFNEIKLENKLSLLDKREKKNHSAKKLKVHGNRGVEIFHHTGLLRNKMARSHDVKDQCCQNQILITEVRFFFLSASL